MQKIFKKGAEMRSVPRFWRWRSGSTIALLSNILALLLSLPCVELMNPPTAPLSMSARTSRSTRLVRSVATALVADDNSAPGFFAQLSEKVGRAKSQLLGGAVGRVIAVSCMFPVDTVKTRLQLYGGRMTLSPSEWSDALRRPLLKGLPLSLFGQVPNGMLVYGSYEVYKREIHERFPGMNPNQVRLLAALSADITGAFWLAPFERTKQTVQAGTASGMRNSLATVISEKGILGLYAGFKAQVVRDLAFHAIQLPLYESIKEAWLRKVHLEKLLSNNGGREEAVTGRGGIGGGGGGGGQAARRTDLQPLESMICGALAGATSGALTTPFDVLKTRIMTCTMDCAGGSVRTEFLNVYYNQGLLGFTAGLPQRALYIACGSAIFWTVFEQTVRAAKTWDLPQQNASTPGLIHE